MRHKMYRKGRDEQQYSTPGKIIIFCAFPLGNISNFALRTFALLDGTFGQAINYNN